VCSWLADRAGARRHALIALALVDAALLLACAAGPPVAVVLGLRVVQGAASVGALSILMADAGALGGPAVIAGIVLGAPLGTALGALGPRAPLLAASACAAIVAAGRVPARGPRARQPLRKALPFVRVPVVCIAAERFAVGCFVVTMSIHAHRVLGLSDGDAGGLYSWFLVPFALAAVPAAALAARADRAIVLAIAAIAYGGAFAAFGRAHGAALDLALASAGAASAALYVPSLALLAELAPPELRATAMALGNAGGTLGMLVGTAGAGIASAALRAHGLSAATADAAIFAGAGALSAGAVLVAVAVLSPRRRACEVAP
jgi:DHA1 family tetracycline resistance protein-like MFS transporter